MKWFIVVNLFHYRFRCLPTKRCRKLHDDSVFTEMYVTTLFNHKLWLDENLGRGISGFVEDAGAPLSCLRARDVTVDVGFLFDKATMFGDAIKRTRRLSTTFCGRDWNVVWQNCSQDSYADDLSPLDINPFCYWIDLIGVPVVSIYRSVQYEQA
jgi:hypothetical protein